METRLVLVRERPAGPTAVLLDFDGHDRPLDAVAGVAAALRSALDLGQLTGVSDIVPTESTILVQADGPLDVLGVRRVARAGSQASTTPVDERSVEISVNYDGPDLAEVADRLGMSVAEVVAAHSDTRWRVAFMGFAPGFGYLVPDAATPLTTLGRRAQSRPRVDAGSVAIAAGYSAVYPTDSPGGWFLLGHTDARLWQLDATPPALLEPGTWVRFVGVEP